MEYDYEKVIKDNTEDLSLVKGKTLEAALANIVGGELNVIHLLFEDIWFSANGLLGSEILEFHRREEKFEKVEFNKENCVIDLPVLNQFIGMEVVEIRQIGTAWNGHGFDFSFKNIPEISILIQSIYTGSEPEDFSDCMRVGVGNYIYYIDPT